VKVLVINMDSVGEMLPFCIRCIKAGHSVRLYLSGKNHPETADGFRGLEKVDNWLPSVKWADLIVPSGNHLFLAKLDSLRDARIFGPTVASADLEIQRQKGMKFFEDHDIDVPEYKTFKTLDEAESRTKKRRTFCF
jgi:phosphoribosylamine-glycine ligase